VTHAWLLGLLLLGAPSAPAPGAPAAAAIPAVREVLLARHGEAQRDRIERGLAQAAASWRASDGDAAAFAALAEEQFLSDAAALDATFERFESALEQLDGHALEANRFLARHAVLDLGPLLPVDQPFAGLDAGAHLTDDLFGSRLAFAALLNFPLTTLAEREAQGQGWTRRQWAEARLLGRRGALVGGGDGGLSQRVPASVKQAAARAYAGAQAYVAGYNLYAHHLLDAEGRRLFPKGKRLLAHWNLRDEIKASYGQPDALARQRILARAMERVVAQTIPRAVVNDPRVDWEPLSNRVRPAPAETIEGGAPPLERVDGAREPDLRYGWLLANFRAARDADPYSPAAPSFVARKFEVDREMPEERVVALLEEVLRAPQVAALARLIRERLGRPLEPFDVWYAGFRPTSRPAEGELDARTRRLYPAAAALARDLPRMLEALGFAPERARFLAERIVVEPARGSGHAMPAARRGDRVHLRTRIGPEGMDYKSFHIAVHEMGHNVEQVLSLYEVDHTLLMGVPGNAFTEALAFLFQSRDLELLGLTAPTPEDRRLAALNQLWMTYEIAGVALVDLRTWRWLYRHPRATPAELRRAVLAIAREVWDAYYAPHFGVRGSTLLAVYSHLVSEPLYLPDYPLGHLVAAQLEEHADRAGRLGPEVERQFRFGSVAPDLWMRHATGEPLSARALLQAAERALPAEPGAAPPAPRPRTP
jgi:hypothetical protein